MAAKEACIIVKYCCLARLPFKNSTKFSCIWTFFHFVLGQEDLGTLFSLQNKEI